MAAGLRRRRQLVASGNISPLKASYPNGVVPPILGRKNPILSRRASPAGRGNLKRDLPRCRRSAPRAQHFPLTKRALFEAGYCGPARIDAGWPGNLMRCPVSVSMVPSTFNTDMSRR
jgi:hypothetical protein